MHRPTLIKCSPPRNVKVVPTPLDSVTSLHAIHVLSALTSHVAVVTLSIISCHGDGAVT